MASASDNFNRADNVDLGANWDPIVSSLQIVTNRVRATALGTVSFERYNAFTPTNDQETQVTVATFTGADVQYAYAAVRMSADASPNEDLYRAAAGRNDAGVTTYLQKVVNGANTNIATENATTWAAGDTLRIRVVGTNLTVFRNGVSLLTGVDADIASGNGGLGIFQNVTISQAEIDDWSVTDVGGGGGGGGIAGVAGVARRRRRV